MLKKLASLNERLIEIDEKLAAAVRTMEFHQPTRCGIVAMVALLTLFLLALFSPENAQASVKCTKRAADPLITQRFQECSPREMLSYLYNNIVTPFSYDCAMKVKDTCQKEDCAAPKDEEKIHRCQVAYVQVLKGCQADLEGAAKMARCKDTKTWPVEDSETELPTNASRSSTETLRRTHAAEFLRPSQVMRASQSSPDRR
ncbi:MAG: hypothetical protein H7301_06680 [Cryobacterium sp.]|nr:hypothetical protein [Oligoflexia bacterium]